MSQKYEQILRESVQKLELGPNDLLIVKSLEAMSTFLEMTQQGVGFSKYANPVLLIPAALKKRLATTCSMRSEFWTSERRMREKRRSRFRGSLRIFRGRCSVSRSHRRERFSDGFRFSSSHRRRD